jgi:hypothetical protein
MARRLNSETTSQTGFPSSHFAVRILNQGQTRV